MSANNRYYFLGGHDLEMAAIRGLLDEFATGRFCDKSLKWGAKTSDYRAEITEAVSKGMTPVLIELEDDIGLGEEVAIKVDHHGERAGAGKPTSLEQVFKLLELPTARWTRWLELVCANDKGYIPALVTAGTSQEEIMKIRAEDRRAQGVTEEEEKAGIEAIDKAEVLMDWRLTVIHLSHGKSSVVTDKLDRSLGGRGYENLLVISPGELNFYGDGRLIIELEERFGGWSGGELPERGFWGVSGLKDGVEDKVIEFLKQR